MSTEKRNLSGPRILRKVPKKNFYIKEGTQGRCDVHVGANTKGVEIAEHIHHAQDDIIYVLQGRFKLRAEGADHEVNKGTLIRVPKGIKHMIYDMQEDTLLYDVFVPATL